MTTQPKNRQNLIDVALEHCGTFEAAMQIALLNGISLTDDLEPSVSLQTPEVEKKRVVTNFQSLRHAPATGITTAEIADIADGGEGIDFWGIEIDFIVQ